MCGIFGALGEGFDPRHGLLALDAIAHRGPDGSHHVADPEHALFLGHRRLSIIDLSESGRQPMTNEDGSLLLTYNGEIYNHAELRAGLERRGHRFSSTCDAEVVLHLYEEEGPACLERLHGMFAFGLYDRSARRLFLARDRLGLKPLYTYQDDGLFAFASELKALRALPTADLAPDVTAYYDYLTYRFVPAPKTIYRRARKLPAGHWLELDFRDGRPGEARVQRWWDVDFAPEEDLTAEGALEALEPLLEEVVRDHLVSDVEVGTFLSSGVDSALVTALARRASGRAPRAFTISFPERANDEVEGAGAVAALLGAEQTVGRFQQREVEDRAGLLFDVFDEPFADHAALPMLDLAELAARDVKVVLSGDGGDETHAGYGRYAKGERRDRVYSALDGLPFLKRTLLRGPALRVPWMRDLAEEPRGRRHAFHAGIPRETKRAFLDVAGGELADYDDYWLLREGARPGVSRLAGAQLLDLTTLLPEGHLTKVDRTSMRYGLEVRPPLLDHRLVEFAGRLPDRLRRGEEGGKPLLRTLLGRILPGYDQAPKLGFSIPLKHFVAERGLFRLQEDVEVFDAFRIDRRRVERVLSPRRNSMELWMLWVLASFLSAHEERASCSA
jgi:asparagine synthase (glutamine-hydrolysing)